MIINFCQKFVVLAFQLAGHCFLGHNFEVLFLTLLTIHVGLVQSGTTTSAMQEINNNAICNMSLGIMRQQKKHDWLCGRRGQCCFLWGFPEIPMSEIGSFWPELRPFLFWRSKVILSQSYANLLSGSTESNKAPLFSCQGECSIIWQVSDGSETVVWSDTFHTKKNFKGNFL